MRTRGVTLWAASAGVVLAVYAHLNAQQKTAVRAFTDGEIVRTHVLRPTWHFVAAEDLGWMLNLTAPRIHIALRTFMRHNELDAKRLMRAARVMERALEGRRYRTRRELSAALSRAGLVFKQARGRERIVRSNTEAIRHARHLLEQLEEVWRARLERFEDTLFATEGGDRR